MLTPLTFIQVGFGNVICANKVAAVLVPNASAAKRRLKQAKERGNYQDMTFGRSVKGLILLDDGTIVGCGLSAKTLMERLARKADELNEPRKQTDFVSDDEE